MDANKLENLFNSRAYLMKWGDDLEKQANGQYDKVKRNDKIIKDVKDIFMNICEGCIDIILYGSRVTGLATKEESDIDLLIDTSKNQSVEINCPVSENWMLNKALKFIREHRSETWMNAYAIFTCRTPVLKIVHRATNMSCDITVMGQLGVCNTNMMKLYIKNTPYLRQMILVAREWLIACDLTQYIHNYTISILVLFYLQIEKYVVPVKDFFFVSEKVEMDPTGYEMIDFDDINYNNFTVRNITSTNLHNLLIGFFDYYSNFDFENDVVCPLLGHPIKKKLFEFKNLKKLPAEMSSYIQNVKKKKNPFKIDRPMCVQDPLDLSHNLIKVQKKDFAKTFQDLCLTTVALLKNLK